MAAARWSGSPAVPGTQKSETPPADTNKKSCDGGSSLCHKPLTELLLYLKLFEHAARIKGCDAVINIKRTFVFFFSYYCMMINLLFKLTWALNQIWDLGEISRSEGWRVDDVFGSLTAAALVHPNTRLRLNTHLWWDASLQSTWPWPRLVTINSKQHIWTFKNRGFFL